MTKIVLVSNVQIIKQIFTLVANKLSVELIIVGDVSLAENCDILVLDDDFIASDLSSFKNKNIQIGLLSKETQTNDDFAFEVKKPFLPSTLQEVISSLIVPKNVSVEKVPFEDDSSSDISVLLQEESAKFDTNSSSSEDSVEDLISFIDNLASDDEDDTLSVNLKELDEDLSLINEEEMGHGGVLDKVELSKLHEMISENTKSSIDTDDMNDKNWLDLSHIIDKAIDDVQEYEFNEDEPIKLKLNQFSIEELSPLLKKLNQNVVDKLTSGKKISLELRFEEK